MLERMRNEEVLFCVALCGLFQLFQVFQLKTEMHVTKITRLECIVGVGTVSLVRVAVSFGLAIIRLVVTND